MPSKGQDLDALTASTVMEHLSNAVGVFTPKGFPHPCSKSVEISVIFESQYVEIGETAGFKPTAEGESAAFDAAGIGFESTFNVKGQSQVYKIIAPQSGGAGVTLMVLEKSS